MSRSLFIVLSCLLALSALCVAADLTGKWTAQVPGRDGQTRETTFDLKAAGATLTGTMSGRGEPTPIADGKIEGDAISFTVTRTMGDNTVKLNYTGKVVGDEIQMKRQGGQGEPISFVAKRAK